MSWIRKTGEFVPRADGCCSDNEIDFRFPFAGAPSRGGGICKLILFLQIDSKEIGDKFFLQDDIDKLVKWSEKWQMLFNFGKCKCLHTGPGNTGMNYEMGGTILTKTVKEKDLGVTMNCNMKVSEQCRIAASKGSQVLGMIRRNITYKEKSLIVPLYKAIVRPHLEYCIQAWNPHLRKDIDMLEKIQRRATKLIPGLRDLRYEERLKECGLTTLETRRLRGDQIEVFKIVNGYENIDSNIFFEI